MPSTYSQNLRIELIASGEQGNTWGNTTNNNLGTLIERAISGFSSIDTLWTSNACTLTALNGANDQARNMFLEIPSSVSLSAEGQLTAPTVPKMYVIKNNSSGGYAVRIKTGSSSTTCLIPNGTTKVVVCDGVNFSEATTAAADFYVANAPTLGSQVTNKTYVDTADDLRLKRDGSQNMTGELVLSAGTAPSNALGAVSKQYVQGTFLPLTGGTLSGALTLPSVAPSSTWQAVPKAYVDFLIPGIATTSSLGTVKVGSGLAVGVDGTLSATGTAGVGSIAVTSPIQNTGTATNVALSMIPDAYYPYTGNPSGFVTSAGSVNYADFAGSAGSASTLGGLSASSFIQTSGTQTITVSPNTTTPAFLGVFASASGQTARLGQYYSSSAGQYTSFIGAHIGSGTSTSRPPLAFIQQYGSTIAPFMSSTTNGELSINSLQAGGSVSANAVTGILTVSSDQNLKVADGFISEALPLVEALLPRYFYWKDEEGNPDTDKGRQLGFFAQEVQSISEEASPTGRGIYDRALVAVLTKAIQELNAKVTALTAEVEALKGA